MKFSLRHRFSARLAACGLVALMTATTVAARENALPYSWTHPMAVKAAKDVPVRELAAVDAARELARDAQAMDPAKSATGAVEKRLRVAVGNAVSLTPRQAGAWESLPDGSHLWRLTLSAPNATDLHFGFSRFQVAQGVTLHVTDDAAHAYDGAYTAADTSPDGQLWLPPVSGSRLTLELHVPAGVDFDPRTVVLSSVGAGYRNVNERNGPGLLGAGPSGNCNIDVICPLGDPYRDEIRSVAKYYYDSGNSTYLCTGTLVNDTAQDFKNYFLSANHCISTQAEATTMRFFFNYESPTCGQHGGDNQNQQTLTGGAQLRAHRADVDFSLTELNNTPPADFNVFYAGWDASGSIPDGAIGVHHPSGWVKAITETAHALTTMNSCIGSGSQTHWRTGQPYAQGTTEGGSSGSAIFVPSGDTTGHDNLIIGTLSGGSADCSASNPSEPNNGYDCYGKFAVAWDGTSAAQRLKDWLDPANSGVTTLPGADPAGAPATPNIVATPPSIAASADAGATATASLSIANTGTAALTWTADTADSDCAAPSTIPWLSLAPASGSVASGGTPSSVTVTFDAGALGAGDYEANICVHSNDAAHDPLAVPVSFTVNALDPCDAKDTIFCDGFDGDEADGRISRTVLSGLSAEQWQAPLAAPFARAPGALPARTRSPLRI